MAAMRSPMDRGGAAYLDPLPATQSGAEQPVLVPLRALPATPGCEEAGQGIADTYRLINSETFGAGRTLKVVWPTKTWSASDPAPPASHVQVPFDELRRWPARVEIAPAKAVLLLFGRRGRAHGHRVAQKLRRGDHTHQSPGRVRRHGRGAESSLRGAGRFP